MARIGVLALQGDFSAHAAALRRLGEDVLEVRRCGQLHRLRGLVLPGGESTTLLNLMRDESWFEALRGFHERGGAFLATCAGAILLSRKVINPIQPSVGVLDAVIERNGFGRQVDSFETRIDAPALGGPLQAVFIRAPRFREVGAEVEVLAKLGDEPVMVRQGRILALTFHPELTGDGRLHDYFVRMAGNGRIAATALPMVAAAS